MENEEKLNDVPLPENAFQLEYAGQKLNEDNIVFRRWHDKMIEKFGRKAKLFKCIKDNIYFYASNEDCKSYPFYQSRCPCCNNPICYYCHRYNKDSYGNGLCCLSRKFYCFFFQDGLRLINPIAPDHDYPQDYDQSLTYFLIPGLNLLFFMATMHTELFYKLSLSNDLGHNGYLRNYEDRYKNNYTTLQILVGIDIAFSLVLTFCYLLLNIYFIIILLIISIPFKFYPMKYYMGIAYGTMY